MVYIGTFPNKARRYIYFYKDSKLYIMDEPVNGTSMIYYGVISWDISKNIQGEILKTLNVSEFPLYDKDSIDYNITVMSENDIFERIDEMIFKNI